jgi:hypothetical protein
MEISKTDKPSWQTNLHIKVFLNSNDYSYLLFGLPVIIQGVRRFPKTEVSGNSHNEK